MINNDIYKEDLEYIASLDLPWEKLEGAQLMISGATGMLGTLLVDAIMYKNEKDNLGCYVLAMGRDADKAFERFADHAENEFFEFYEQDVTRPMTGMPGMNYPLYIVHMASNTHPRAYAKDPIGTITTNILGTYDLLEYATDPLHDGKCRFCLVSSNEIYGENRGDTELFDESYCGYIDCNTLRAGYPESKRCSESLCQAYISQNKADAVIARLTRSYGPTLLPDDSKAMTQFLKNAVAGEDIVLKSKGDQYYSYTYAADAVAGLLTVLLLGECGKAYNVADTPSDITLKELAELIAGHEGKKVVFDIPDSEEAAGFSKATKARLDGSAIKSLGWSMHYDIKTGIDRTLRVLKENG